MTVPRTDGSCWSIPEVLIAMCGWRSPSSDDGYCPCILPVHQGSHMCLHGWLDVA